MKKQFTPEQIGIAEKAPMKAEQIQNLILGEKNAFGDIFLNGKIALENGRRFTKFFCRELALAIENKSEISAPDSGNAFFRLVLAKIS